MGARVGLCRCQTADSRALSSKEVKGTAPASKRVSPLDSSAFKTGYKLAAAHCGVSAWLVFKEGNSRLRVDDTTCRPCLAVNLVDKLACVR